MKPDAVDGSCIKTIEEDEGRWLEGNIIQQDDTVVISVKRQSRHTKVIGAYDREDCTLWTNIYTIDMIDIRVN